ncbi:beta-N-acetylhexosaminidase [Paenibacillus phyllosphaerae]|uniref:beta-N-acetylhexosaminidase n=1 Tax=Paenibacillus phyllosphaerae TaxID=274593 RepID=A0A7W5FN04_9BACL|nr:beta-N-acetylhexosaminidase [Paenibacillus phyllosphaerae]MBB3110637.1 beta-N-acetylhexosaminidase [Paenibacillus phyllosphaerae]
MGKSKLLRIGIMLIVIVVLIAGCSKDNRQESEPGNGQGEQTSDNRPEAPDVNAGTADGGQDDGAAEGGNDQPEAEPDDELSPEDEAAAAAQEELQRQLAAMTLEEKIGQLLIAGVDGTQADEGARRMVQEQHVGSVIFYKDNLKSVAGMTNYVNQLKAWNAGNPAPLMLSVDQEGGKVSRLPELAKLPNARQIGNTGKTELAEDIGTLLAEACAAMGINVNYAPVLDINSNPDNPVIGTRSFGTTAQRVSEMGLATMKGIEEHGVVPVIKHFPGHGDTGVDSHLELPVVQKELSELQAFEWKPFEAAIEQGAEAVMVAHILFPKIDPEYPASLSKTIMTDQLRETLHFDGVIMTDDLTMGAIADHYGMGEAAVQSMKAGTDMLFIAHGYDNIDTVIKALKGAVASGELTETRLDESVLRVLALKRRHQFSDAPTAKADISAINADIAEVLKEFGLK